VGAPWGSHGLLAPQDRAVVKEHGCYCCRSAYAPPISSPHPTLLPARSQPTDTPQRQLHDLTATCRVMQSLILSVDLATGYRCTISEHVDLRRGERPLLASLVLLKIKMPSCITRARTGLDEPTGQHKDGGTKQPAQPCAASPAPQAQRVPDHRNMRCRGYPLLRGVSAPVRRVVTTAQIGYF